MAKPKLRRIAGPEQEVLEHLQVRLLTSEEDIKQCDELIVAHHYLHNAKLVGEQLRYIAVYKGQWLAVATWSAAAFHLKDREDFVGWTTEQCRRRRNLLANNSRLLVLPDCHSPNLLSRFMRLMLDRLSGDWEQRWGHPIALVESFVDPQLYQGTAYKVSGWSNLGRTAGWKRDAADFYQQHETPKQLWVRELTKKACVKLRAEQLPAEWISAEIKPQPRCEFRVGEIRSLMERLSTELTEFRRPQALGYPLPGMVALILMALVTGVRKGPEDLADFGQTLGQGQLRALGFRRKPGTKTIRCPEKTTFHRVLAAVEAQKLEQLLLSWQEQLLGPVQDSIVIIDGKKMRHGGVEMVNATDGNGRYLGGVMTNNKSNEIPAARQLLGQLDVAGKIVLTDALHTNAQTAQQILYEQGGDYLMTVKGNQPTLEKTLERLFKKESFSPELTPERQASTREHNRGRIEIRHIEVIELTPSQACFPGAHLAARLHTRVKRGEQWSSETVYLLSSLTLEQLQAKGMLRLKRGYWVIESRLHHCLDITMQEDQSRIRTPNSARVMGMIRRVILSLTNAAVDRARALNPKTKFNTKRFRQRFLKNRGGQERLHALIFAKQPAVLELTN